jgi:hypothetical protein
LGSRSIDLAAKSVDQTPGSAGTGYVFDFNGGTDHSDQLPVADGSL